jgi:hypothetical protein
MKTILLIFILAFCLSSYAQTPPGIEKPILSNAILPECYNSDSPFYCNKQKLENILSSVITDDLITDLPSENKKNFSLSCLFFTGKDGKVIPELTEVRSESNKLKEAITLYINTSLPEFLTKNIKYTEQRSAHIVGITYIRNPKTNGFYIAYESDIKKNKIQTNYIIPEKAPLFFGCTDETSYEKQLECTKKKIYDYIVKNYRKPKSELYANLLIQLTVDSDGKVHVNDIMGSSPNEYEYEVYRVVNTLPVLKPAIIKGISSTTSFRIPPLAFK